MTPLQFRFRTKLLLTLLVLVVVTTAAVGIASNLITRRTADSLASHILEQTSARIADRVVSLVRSAAIQGELTHRLLLNTDIPPYKLPTADDFPILTAYFYEVMRVHPHLTFLSLGLEAKGEYCHVERKFDGSLVQQECIRNSSGKIERSDYVITNGVRQRISFNPDWGYDPRRRPYYIAAVEAGRQTWTETYVFVNDPSPDSPGVTCATPIYGTNHTLLGVLSVDFNLEALCGFLKELPVGRRGFAVVVEVPKNKPLQLIAHPKLELLIKQIGNDHWLISTDEIKDPRSRALMEHLAAARAGTAPGGARFDPLRALLQPEGDSEAKRTVSRDARFEFTTGGVSYLSSCRRLRAEDMPEWLICTVVPEAEIMSGVWRSNRITLLIGLASLVVAFLVSIRVSRQVARPLERLAQETEAVGRLDLESREPVPSNVREIQRLATATEEMKTGLRSFRRYVPAELVRSLVASGREAKLGGERKVVTVWFSDIADFTTIAEQLAPDALVAQLGEHISVVSAEILKARGTVDKYIGDSIMAFWGAPEPDPRHAASACAAAVRSQERLKELHLRHRAEGRPVMGARFGLDTGEVIVGNIGSEARLNYTVVGDTVNLANRLEGLNKFYGTDILISEATFLEARDGIVARPLNWVAVKGRAEVVLVYELLGLKGETDPACREFAALCSQALASYSQQDWARAIRLFQKVLRIRAHDRAAQMIIARCKNYQEKPPGEKWDKAHRLESK